MPIARTPKQERKLMALLNEAGPILRNAVATLQTYVEENDADLTEVEVAKTIWACDDKLVIIYDLQLSDDEADEQSRQYMEDLLDYMTPSNIIYSI